MSAYNPPRQAPGAPSKPIEIDLVYQVRACGICTFFWPDDVDDQPYGPFPIFDFLENTPQGNQPPEKAKDYAWVKGRTRAQGFPNPEIMDGCRKAPIMTIGINPNLTAFAPGLEGTSWAYPGFTSDNGTDEWTKYAYYYRYRSVFQEHLSLSLIEKYLDTTGQVHAENNGELISVERTSDAPGYDITVVYDGETQPTTIKLNRALGTDRYVVLLNHHKPNNRFKKGQVIASKLDVPADVPVEIFQEQIGYYMQFVPVLQQFESYLKSKGHPEVNLQIGEDVCQLDMVACASPHWNGAYLGGEDGEKLVISNCVHKNAWAIKQLVQTKPAILFLVGESSYNMFRDNFYYLLKRDIPLSKYPVDGAFTLFRETIDPAHPCTIEFSTTIDGINYQLSTRLVVTPHFSYDSNFAPQFRMSGDDWKTFQSTYAACSQFLTTDDRLRLIPPEKEGYFFEIEIKRDTQSVINDIQAKFSNAWNTLSACYYDAHEQMAAVLQSLYDNNQITYTATAATPTGHLTRTEGACHFCVNDQWQFPLGCPYKKTDEKSPPIGFLEKVANAFVSAGSSSKQKIASS